MALEAAHPEDSESFKAREGTAAHFYATERLQGRVHQVGSLAPNGHPIDNDMVDGGDLLFETVAGYLTNASPSASVRVETKIEMHALVHPLNEGTPDWFMYDAARKRIVVIDYKYGHGYVDVVRNWQLLDYLAGVLEAFELSPWDIQTWAVELCIVQPRFYRGEQVRTWPITHEELVSALAYLWMMAHSDDTVLQTGAHCKDCLGQAQCPANAKVAGYSADLADLITPPDATPAQLAWELRQLTLAADRLNARKAALEESIRSILARGGSIPWWGLERAYGRKRWLQPIPDVLRMGDLLGVNLRKEPDALTPAQAIKAGLPAVIVDDMAAASPTEPKLVMVNMAERFNRR